MYCMHCGAKNDEGQRYCNVCGSPLDEIAGQSETRVYMPEPAPQPARQQKPGVMAPLPVVGPRHSSLQAKVHERQAQEPEPFISSDGLSDRALNALYAILVIGFLGVGASCAHRVVSSRHTHTVEPPVVTAPATPTQSETETDTTEEAPEPATPPVFSAASASSELPQDEPGSNYKASQVLDSDTNTAWSEAADGAGIGEWVLLSADEPQLVSGVRIVNGYPRSTTHYSTNNRVRRATITLSDGYSTSVELTDERGRYQTIEFDEPHAVTTLLFTIDSVYQGSSFSDTLIAEIEAF